MISNKEIIDKLKKGFYVSMKVSIKHREVVMEVTNPAGIMIEHDIVTTDGDLGQIDEILAKLRLKMMQKAGEYRNKGFYVDINPFNN